MKVNLKVLAMLFLLAGGAVFIERSGGISAVGNRILFAMAGKEYPKKQTSRMPTTKPRISLKINNGEISYVHHNRVVSCDSGTSAGCTNSEIYMDPVLLDYTPDGEIKTINLSLGIENLRVEISSEYPKGSCQYDIVMEHEMRHVAYARGTLAKYAPMMARAIQAKAETFPVPITQSSYNELVTIANGYFALLIQEKTSLDDALDSRGQNAYEWNRCVNDPVKSVKRTINREMRRKHR